eukprot:3397287-Prymnesium_polylepis.2
MAAASTLPGSRLKNVWMGSSSSMFRTWTGHLPASAPTAASPSRGLHSGEEQCCHGRLGAVRVMASSEKFEGACQSDGQSRAGPRSKKLRTRPASASGTLSAPAAVSSQARSQVLELEQRPSAQCVIELIALAFKAL